MAAMVEGLRHWAGAVDERVHVLLRRARARWRTVDHLGRAYVRYRDQRGNRLAAALSFYGFLSFFPVVALGFAVTGYAVEISPQVRDAVAKAIDQILPELSHRLPVDQ